MSRHRQPRTCPPPLLWLAGTAAALALVLLGTPAGEPSPPRPPAPSRVQVGSLDRCPPGIDVQIANELHTYCVQVIPPPAQLPPTDPFDEE